MNMQNILHNHSRHAALFPLCNDFRSTVCYYFVKHFRKDRGIVTMQKKKRLIISCAIAAAVAAALLLYLMPRRADMILHLPESAAGIREVYFQRIEPVHETLEYFCQDYTLTAEREPELLQEVCDWLYAARLNRPMPGSGVLHDPGVMYTLRARSSDNSATAAIQILEDGRAVVNGVLYRLRQKDMAALNTIYQHLNTIYD